MDIRLLERVRSDFALLTSLLIKKRITVSLMESCTGGLTASLLTDTPGASDVFRGSIVAYSNEEKRKAGVSSEVLRTFGVYSGKTTEAMALSAKRYYETDIGIGISGSLCSTDPHNEDSIPGEVWYTIDLPEEKYSGKLLVPAEYDRFEAKLYTAGEVAKRLLGILGGKPIGSENQPEEIN